MLAYLGFSHPLLVHLCALSAHFLKNLGTFCKNKGTFSENKGRNERNSAGFSTGILTGIGAPRHCAFSSASAHKHKTNSLSPSCFFNTGAGQRLKRSARPVHFDEAGLASSPLLVARYGAYRLLRHTLVGFLPKTGTENKKNTITLQQKKQNNYLCSKMRVVLRAAGRRNAFRCALALSSGQCRLPAGTTHGAPSRARAPQDATHTPSKHNARIRCASTKKINSTHLLIHK